MINYNNFITSINEKKLINVRFLSKQDSGIVTRKCVPFDFGPSRVIRDGKNRYHFYVLDDPVGKHNAAILPENIYNIDILEESFEPGDYVHWTPRWFVRRDWGIYS